LAPTSPVPMHQHQKWARRDWSRRLPRFRTELRLEPLSPASDDDRIEREAVLVDWIPSVGEFAVFPDVAKAQSIPPLSNWAADYARSWAIVESVPGGRQQQKNVYRSMTLCFPGRG